MGYVRGCLCCVKFLLQLMKALLNVCVHSVRFMGSLILPLFGVLCGLIIKINFPFRLQIPGKNRSSVGDCAAEVNYYVI